MTEKVGHEAERGESFKAEQLPERQEAEPTKEKETSSEKFDAAKLEKMAREAERKARGKDETKVEDKQPKEHGPLHVNKQLKDMTYKRSLAHIRHRLSWRERTLSKITHQPVIDTISRVGERTVARPAGILGAGLIALIGSIVVLYQAKHFGFRYNLTIFLLLLLGGYIFGLILEFLTRSLSKRR